MRLSAILFIVFFMVSGTLIGQNEPVIVVAESGTLGAD
jgi:hypothetical protein